MTPPYKRAIKLKSYATRSKKKKIEALIRRYRKQVNLFIDHCWQNENAKLDKTTFDSVEIVQNLSQRYKATAQRRALSLCSHPMTKNKPKFTGYPVLDAKFITIKSNKTSNLFDLWIGVSVLKKGHRIQLPTKKHKRLNYWSSKENATLIQGCELRPDGFIVWVDTPLEKRKETGMDIGVDIGMNKLIMTSYGESIGTDFNTLNDRILRKQKNSAAYKKILQEKKNYINQCINELPWQQLKTICYENLKNLKKGRKRNKSLRQKQQYWSYRQVIDGLKLKAQENRVRLVYINPAYTSQKCSSCGNIAASSRVLEKYCCVACGYKQDADWNAATNILHKGQEWITSLKSVKSKNQILTAIS